VVLPIETRCDELLVILLVIFRDGATGSAMLAVDAPRCVVGFTGTVQYTVQTHEEQWPMENGEWRMEIWRMENGEWRWAARTKRRSERSNSLAFGESGNVPNLCVSYLRAYSGATVGIWAPLRIDPVGLSVEPRRWAAWYVAPH